MATKGKKEEEERGMALKGIKVLELAGLAPAPFCGLILADFGAEVIRVDRAGVPSFDNLSRGKLSLSLNLKHPDGISLFKSLSRHVDVIIDPYRPGVMEKMGLAPEELMKENERLIVARLTGFGQTGPLSQLAGHDINYLSIAGSLSLSSGSKPEFTANILGDFAGGGTFCALGILLAIIERNRSGKGQIIDAAMVDGCNYLNSFVYANLSSLFPSPRAHNLLDGAAPFYGVYETKDGKYMSVGALEPPFYDILVKSLNVSDDPLIASSARMDPSNWPYIRSRFTSIFLSKTQSEWREIFEKTDGCVHAVVEKEEFAEFENSKEREMMFKQKDLCGDDVAMPTPAPRLSRSSPSLSSLSLRHLPLPSQHTLSVLRSFNVPPAEILRLADLNAIELSPDDLSSLRSPSSKL